MLRLLLILWLVLAAGPGVGQGVAEAAPLKNVLGGHASPYLAMHGQDPVAWQEWNAETLARAKRENKLLFVSVGYFSCHWCHVMQRESYQAPAIAKLLNEHFIPVKVDRELNGALDAGLIDFAEQLNGVAGWPLNAFVTPEGYPAYAVLYEPPEQFQAMLTRMTRAWREQGKAFSEAARKAGSVPQALPAISAVTPAAVDRAHLAFMKAFWPQADTLQGGFNRVSKFPMASHLAYLLETFAQDKDPRLGEFLILTLDQMANLGLRDHVNGGFFRYTVDPGWSTPHFEKMLYDNAQLARLYSRAAEVFKRPDYQRVAHATLDFMLADLAAPGGGFYTALSALDTRGREGGAYLWSTSELRQRISPDEFALVKRLWGLDASAPFELGYLPMQRLKPSAAEQAKLAIALSKLKRAGRARLAPKDTKINAGLNGLALSALVAAGKGTPRYDLAAGQLKDFLAKRMFNRGRLLKTLAGNRVFTDAELDDYAYAAAGLADYAKAFQDTGADALAKQLVTQAWQRFFSPNGWRREERPLLATLAPEPALIDGALPSASSVLLGVSNAITTERSPALQRHMESAAGMLLATMDRQAYDHPTGLRALQSRAAK